ncbi:hypothetical protein L195_g037009, partial [Trifolium pratense]
MEFANLFLRENEKTTRKNLAAAAVTITTSRIRSSRHWTGKQGDPIIIIVILRQLTSFSIRIFEAK